MPARILVVGCGPTGLTVAGVLKKHGVDVTIIDKYPGVLKATKAAAIHARTLEVLDTLGAAGKIVAEGQKVEFLNLRTKHEDRLVIRFDELPDTRYPFMIDLPQYRTEELLIERLGEMGVELRRSVELIDLRQDGDRVHVTLQPKNPTTHAPEGAAEEAEYDYVVGCDGAHSTVREKVGKAFAGEHYADHWCLTDAKVDWPIPRNEMTFASDDTGICGMFPLPEPGHFRVVYTQWMDAEGKPIPPDRENMIRAIRRQGFDPKVEEVGEFWTFGLDHRQVDAYRAGNVFLVGDAGHVHTPFGGQGMNLGISDAQNLAWKLAAVANGAAGAALLDSFNAERHPVAKGVIKLTHAGATAMLIRKGPKAALRDWAFELVNQPTGLKQTIAVRLSQLSLSYRHHSIFSDPVDVGDRLPDTEFFDGYDSAKHWLHNRLKPDALNLVLGVKGVDAAPVDAAIEALVDAKRRSPIPLRVQVYSQFRIDDHARFPEVEDWAYDRKAELSPALPYDGTASLVRPDSFIGGRGLKPDANAILAAVDRVYARA